MQALFFLTTLLYFITECAPYTNEDMFLDNHSTGQSESILVQVDIGSNYTLPCSQTSSSVTWDRPGYDTNIVKNTQVLEDGSLFFNQIKESDSGLYSCHDEPPDEDLPMDEGDFTRPKASHSTYSNSKIWFRVKVRTPPHELKNITIRPSSILASIMWDSGEDGGYPVLNYHIRYRLKNSSDSDWTLCKPDPISPSERRMDIFHLLPNATYLFELWANNQLGKGVSTTLEVSTHYDMQEIEMGKYLLEGVDSFDSRAWVVAVGIVLGTLIVLGMATCCLFYKEYSLTGLSGAVDSSRRRLQHREGQGEDIELIPNIIFNPVYELQSVDVVAPAADENSNDTAPRHVNNNSVIFPTRV